jgi:hypothetical protein
MLVEDPVVGGDQVRHDEQTLDSRVYNHIRKYIMADRMTLCERVITALKGGIPDRVPWVEP